MRGGVIPRQAYQDVADTSFGTEEITGIQLLSMTKPYTMDGYYYCEGDFRWLYHDMWATTKFKHGLRFDR